MRNVAGWGATPAFKFACRLVAGGVQPRQLGDLLATFNHCLAQARVGRAAEALPRLRAIEVERPESVAVQMALAASASLTNDLRGADRALTRAAKLRPADAKLGALEPACHPGVFHP